MVLNIVNKPWLFSDSDHAAHLMLLFWGALFSILLLLFFFFVCVCVCFKSPNCQPRLPGHQQPWILKNQNWQCTDSGHFATMISKVQCQAAATPVRWQ